MSDPLKGFGTVTKLDLAAHETFGHIEVELARGEIRRLLELAFESLPEKTDYQKKCKDSLWGWLDDSEMEISICPVLNKEVLKTSNFQYS